MVKTCKNGHDFSTLSRSDGRCGKCNTERNRRYRQTPKGKATDFRYAHSAKRRAANTAFEQKPQRWFYKFLWRIRRNITTKREALA